VRDFYFKESAHKKLRVFCAQIMRETKKYTKNPQNGAFFTPKSVSDSLIYRLMNLTHFLAQKIARVSQTFFTFFAQQESARNFVCNFLCAISCVFKKHKKLREKRVIE
jgi:hypothetical protein